MGQKVHPHGFRLGINRTWDSHWYSDKNYGEFLIEDLKLRDFLKKRLAQASISQVEIERAAGKIRIIIHTARPGIVIGPKGSEIEKLRRQILQITDKDVIVDIKEIRKPEVDAQLVADVRSAQEAVKLRLADTEATTEQLAEVSNTLMEACMKLGESQHKAQPTGESGNAP